MNAQVQTQATVTTAAETLGTATTPNSMQVFQTKPEGLPASFVTLQINHILKGSHAEAAKVSGDANRNKVSFYAAFDSASEAFQTAMLAAMPKLLANVVKDFAVAEARDKSPIAPDGKGTTGSLELAKIEDIREWMREACEVGIVAILEDYVTEGQSGRKGAGQILFPFVAPFFDAIGLRGETAAKLIGLLNAGKNTPRASWPNNAVASILKRVKDLADNGKLDANQHRRVISDLDPSFFKTEEVPELEFDDGFSVDMGEA